MRRKSDSDDDGGKAARGNRDEHHIEIDESSRESKAAATGAAVAHALGRPDTIRHRAQNAATISSAVAAALVIAAVAQLAKDDTETWEPWTVALVVLALAFWVLSVVTFLRVVTHGVRPEEGHRSGASTEGRVSYQQLINSYERHSELLRGRLRTASWISLVALALTVAAIAAEVGEEYHSPKHERQVVLSQDAASAVARLCGWTVAVPAGETRINVDVATKELSKSTVLLIVLSQPGQPDGHGCEAPTDRIRLPRSAILATSDIER